MLGLDVNKFLKCKVTPSLEMRKLSLLVLKLIRTRFRLELDSNGDGEFIRCVPRKFDFQFHRIMDFWGSI